MKISAIIMDATKKVPRPLNCFMTYRLEMQREILKQCPGANHRDISRITAKWWKEMSHAEKEPYRRKAEQAKQEHELLYPNYKFIPKKRVNKTRVYKKRSETEYTSEDLKQKQQLDMLYHQGINAASKTDSHHHQQIGVKSIAYHHHNNSTSSATDINNTEVDRSFNSVTNLHYHHRHYLEEGNNASTKTNEDSICCANCFSSLSSSSKTCFSKLQHHQSSTMNNGTRLAPYAIIPSQSVSSPSPLNKYSTTTSSSGYYPALNKYAGINDNNNLLNPPNHYHKSASIQEPPSDPFDSPYSAMTRKSISRDLNNYLHQVDSSSSLSSPPPSFDLSHPHPHHKEETHDNELYYRNRSNSDSDNNIIHSTKFHSLIHHHNSDYPSHTPVHLPQFNSHSLYYQSSHY